jgi:hypothetical protein
MATSHYHKSLPAMSNDIYRIRYSQRSKVFRYFLFSSSINVLRSSSSVSCSMAEISSGIDSGFETKVDFFVSVRSVGSVKIIGSGAAGEPVLIADAPGKPAVLADAAGEPAVCVCQ